MSDKKETLVKPKTVAKKSVAKEESKLEKAKRLNPKAKEVMELGKTIVIRN